MYNAEKVKVWYSNRESESDYYFVGESESDYFGKEIESDYCESDYFVGGVEKSLIEQVREIVEPGFTNTELLPWITAAAAEQEMISFNEGSLVSDEEGWWMPDKTILNHWRCARRKQEQKTWKLIWWGISSFDCYC